MDEKYAEEHGIDSAFRKSWKVTRTMERMLFKAVTQSYKLKEAQLSDYWDNADLQRRWSGDKQG